jgi:hypothetical protein
MDLILGIVTSLHLGLDGDYNSIHPHIGLEYNNILSGAYYNSERNVSAYLGYEFEFEYLNIEGGVVTGYVDDLTLYLRATRDLSNSKKVFIAPAIDLGDDGKQNFGVVLGFEFFLNK